MLVAILVLMATSYWLTENLNTAISEIIDERMDVQIHAIEVAFGPDGRLDRSRLFRLREVAVPRTSWGWQAQSPEGAWQEGVPILRAGFAMPRKHVIRGVYSGNGYTPSGAWMRLRRKEITTPGGMRVVTVAAPEELLKHPLANIDLIIRRQITMLAIFLIVAIGLLLSLGLQPLRLLRDQVARLRNGERQSVATSQPAELWALARELNELVERNQAGLQSARDHVANLAHAIKTPLASLALQLDLEESSTLSRALVAQIGDCIAHHLHRARSAAIGLGERARCDLAAIGEDQVLTMQRLFADRHIIIDNRIPDPCLVQVDGEDMNEMLGNILENACRFARSRVEIACIVMGRDIHLSICDDGPGIAPEAIALAMQPGQRLDEQSEGYGFGLVITRELVDLYGGQILLSASDDLGGLAVSLTLPRQIAV
ncbi:sensor histidine kinase [Novosphingobium terrae]|uniref:sensor histidine kinase n=1 Tax=Novosphingobium terrae TaxID=2726189 RepID=UPI00197EE6ED|nr:HAMP domain-containing sensor histidine kinase [Novosphingobium terrae]